MAWANPSPFVMPPIRSLVLFSGLALKDFAFALFVGVASGTYSSIFVAAPILALFKEREPRYQQIRARAQARAARPGLRAVSRPGLASAVTEERELEPAGNAAPVPGGPRGP